MKKIVILSAGVADHQKIAGLDALPQFRKATFNMKLSCLALQEALLPFGESLTWRKELALFLGTGHGEFNTTLEFLKHWSQSKHARPFVFQNSLHNSTTGFVGLNESLNAPSCTLSHHYYSGEDALDMACQFLLTDACEVAAVVGVDTRAVDHLPLMKDAGFPGADWGQGAGTVIIATEAFAQKHSLQSRGVLHGVEIFPDSSKPIHFVKEGFSLKEFYDSHAVEEFAKVILRADLLASSLVLQKPNGGCSKISWSFDV